MCGRSVYNWGKRVDGTNDMDLGSPFIAGVNRLIFSAASLLLACACFTASAQSIPQTLEWQDTTSQSRYHDQNEILSIRDGYCGHTEVHEFLLNDSLLCTLTGTCGSGFPFSVVYVFLKDGENYVLRKTAVVRHDGELMVEVNDAKNGLVFRTPWSEVGQLLLRDVVRMNR